MIIDYYILNSITSDGDGGYVGQINGKTFPVYEIEGDSDQVLIEKGFVKCDARGTQTFCVEETVLFPQK